MERERETGKKEREKKREREKEKERERGEKHPPSLCCNTLSKYALRSYDGKRCGYIRSWIMKKQDTPEGRLRHGDAAELEHGLEKVDHGYK